MCLSVCVLCVQIEKTMNFEYVVIVPKLVYIKKTDYAFFIKASLLNTKSTYWVGEQKTL